MPTFQDHLIPVLYIDEELRFFPLPISTCLDELISAPKLIAISSTQPPSNKNCTVTSASNLLLFAFVVSLIDPNKQLAIAKSEFKLLDHAFSSQVIKKIYYIPKIESYFVLFQATPAKLCCYFAL